MFIIINTAIIFIDQAKNAEMIDIEGNRYIDFASGIAVTNTGHCHPKVMAAVAKQCERGGNDPDAEMTKHITTTALDHGLILLSCGFYGNTIRLLAPLTIPDAELEEGFSKLEATLTQAA